MDKFWNKVEKTKACWLWTGRVNRYGYGLFYTGRGRSAIASRFSYELANGPIGTGLLVCHTCDNRRCVRPDHLFVGSHADNTRDMFKKNRQNHKRFGNENGMRRHPDARPRGEKHGSAKITLGAVRFIRARYSAGQSQSKLAKSFGISRSQIGSIVRREKWKEVV